MFFFIHVGYYENGQDIEGIFLKVYEEDRWCLFYDDEMYDIKMTNKGGSLFTNDFGCLLGIYLTPEKKLTEKKEMRKKIFKLFEM
ncbi:DUF3986 family protein [Sinobaca sp. H24]|uniref:DUF3986 family protein n=1 Tax=Sinobaca sp. H24 TaxID=2923376 RepID=UPI0035B366B1